MSVVHLVRDSKRRYYIRLVSANGQILAHSEADEWIFSEKGPEEEEAKAILSPS